MQSDLIACYRGIVVLTAAVPFQSKRSLREMGLCRLKSCLSGSLRPP